jgi:hypothetical protein
MSHGYESIIRPLDQTVITTPRGEWTVHVREVSGPTGDNTRVVAHLELQGSSHCALTISGDLSKFVVEHQKGDVAWVVEALRAWLMQPERGGVLEL